MPQDNYENNTLQEKLPAPPPYKMCKLKEWHLYISGNAVMACVSHSTMVMFLCRKVQGKEPLSCTEHMTQII